MTETRNDQNQLKSVLAKQMPSTHDSTRTGGGRAVTTSRRGQSRTCAVVVVSGAENLRTRGCKFSTMTRVSLNPSWILGFSLQSKPHSCCQEKKPKRWEASRTLRLDIPTSASWPFS